jgi:hypothetical protein
MRRRSSSAAARARARVSASASSWRRRSSSAPARAAKTRQRLQLARLGVEPAGGDHAEVADRLAARVVQRDGEVAVEPVGSEERVPGIARASAVGDQQQIRAVRVLARRAGEGERVVLAQRAGAGDRARPVLGQQLGDERDLGAQRARQLGDQAAQEFLADDSGGARGEAGEEIELSDGGHRRQR